MSRFVSLVCLVAMSAWVIAMAGCASIVNGSSQTVAISSEPPGADVTLDNGMKLTTPSSVELKRKNDYVVTISKAGYQTQVVPLNSVLSGWLVGNIVFGGIIGGAIDAGTGAAYTLTPEKIHISLTPLGPGQVDSGVIQGVMSTQQKLDALERLRSQGVVNDKEYEASKAKLNQELKKEITGSA